MKSATSTPGWDLRAAWTALKREARHGLRTSWVVKQSLPRSLAIALVVGGFAAGLGKPTVTAIDELLHGSSGIESFDSDWLGVAKTQAAYLGVMVLLVAAAALLSRHVSERPLLRWRGARREGAAGILWFLSSGTANGLASLVPGTRDSYPFAETTGAAYWIPKTMQLATAGFYEEPLFTILIPLALRSTGMRWRWVIATSALLRMVFHLYYGPGAVTFLLWGAVVVIAVHATGALWGVILAHGLSNLGTILLHSPWLQAQIVGALLIFSFLVVSVVWGLRVGVPWLNQVATVGTDRELT